MKHSLIAAIALAGLTLSSVAAAQGYVGAGIGQARLDTDCSGLSSCDKTDTAYKLYGGYMFTPNLGVEVGYFNHGTFKASLGSLSAEIDGDGFGVWAIGVAPMDKWSLFGKIGMVSSKLDASARANGASGSTSDRNTILGWGIGAGYDFTKNVGLRLEYEGMRLKFQGEKEDVGVFTLGVQYKF